MLYTRQYLTEHIGITSISLHVTTCLTLGINCLSDYRLNVYVSFQFLNVPMFRNVTLKCLTEIAGVSVSQYEEQFVTLFTLTMCQLKQVS